jgi:hypothetical protein
MTPTPPFVNSTYLLVALRPHHPAKRQLNLISEHSVQPSVIMASGKAGGAAALFSEATKAEQLDSHTYRVNLNNAFCIGAGT